MKLSCAAFTAPVEVPVVDAAKSAEAGAPKRTSFPSPVAPLASIRGLPSTSKCVAIPAEPSQSANMAAKSAQPCRWFPTSRPKA